jgi:hypothetical protein
VVAVDQVAADPEAAALEARRVITERCAVKRFTQAIVDGLAQAPAIRRNDS